MAGPVRRDRSAPRAVQASQAKRKQRERGRLGDCEHAAGQFDRGAAAARCKRVVLKRAHAKPEEIVAGRNDATDAHGVIEALALGNKLLYSAILGREVIAVEEEVIGDAAEPRGRSRDVG